MFKFCYKCNNYNLHLCYGSDHSPCLPVSEGLYEEIEKAYLQYEKDKFAVEAL